MKSFLGILLFCGAIAVATGQDPAAAAPAAGSLTLNIGVEGQELNKSITILLMLTVLSLVPSIIMMMTSFTRIIVVLSFFRQALGVQQSLSPRIMASLALFLTFFIMQPTWTRIYEQALLPYQNQEIEQKVAFERGTLELKGFMLNNTRESSLLLFMELGNLEPVADIAELPMRVVVPAFMLSELKVAFQMAFLLFLPFLAIDMLIATLLMAMGMMMVPPVMIALPFKLLLFIMVGGWELLVRVLVSSFT